MMTRSPGSRGPIADVMTAVFFALSISFFGNPAPYMVLLL